MTLVFTTQVNQFIYRYNEIIKVVIVIMVIVFIFKVNYYFMKVKEDLMITVENFIIFAVANLSFILSIQFKYHLLHKNNLYHFFHV